MSSVVLTGDTSGSVTVTVPAVAGSNTATIGAATGTHYPFTAGTAVASTSGTSIDFTSIPSWVKRITVMFSGVSTTGTSIPMIQIGSGSVTSTGYLGTGTTDITGQSPAIVNATTGFYTGGDSGAAYVRQGIGTIVLVTGNNWIFSYTGSLSNGAYYQLGAGSVTLSGSLDRVRITTVGGTDTFDAGSINILYE